MQRHHQFFLEKHLRRDVVGDFFIYNLQLTIYIENLVFSFYMIIFAPLKPKEL